MSETYSVENQGMENISPLACYNALSGCLLEVTFEAIIPATNEDIKNAAEIILRQNLNISFYVLYLRYVMKNKWNDIGKTIGRQGGSVKSVMERFKYLCRAYLLEVYYRRLNNNTTDLQCYPIDVLPTTSGKLNALSTYLSQRCPTMPPNSFSLAHVYALIQSGEIVRCRYIWEGYSHILHGMLARFYRTDIPKSIEIEKIRPVFPLPNALDYMQKEKQGNQKIPGLGERIQMVIKQSSLSNEEASKYLKISSDTLVLFIQEIEIPSMDTLIRIAKQFNVSISYLLVG